MAKKEVIISFSVISIVIGILVCIFCLQNKSTDSTNITNTLKNTNTSQVNTKNIANTQSKLTEKTNMNDQTELNNKKLVEHKCDLYSETPYDIPLSSISEIAKLTPRERQIVNNILENSQGFYFLKQDPKTKEITILLQNSIEESNTYTRHNLQFAKILQDGSVTYSNAGYSGTEGETSSAITKGTDLWEFDKTIEPYRPLKHVAFDEKKKVKFTEIWNYNNNSDIKYEMKNGEGKIISILKGTSDSETNYREEHVFYDKTGNTEMSFSASFEEANIKRFTYYDANDNQDSLTIESSYNTDGLKSEEKIYNNEYKLQNTVTADYKDGERVEIKVLDSNGNELEKLTN